MKTSSLSPLEGCKVDDSERNSDDDEHNIAGIFLKA